MDRGSSPGPSSLQREPVLFHPFLPPSRDTSPPAPAPALRSCSASQTRGPGSLAADYCPGGGGGFGGAAAGEEEEAAVAVVLYKWTNIGRWWRPRWFAIRGGVLAYSKIRRRVAAEETPPEAAAGAGVRLIGGVARGAGEQPIGFVHLKLASIRPPNRPRIRDAFRLAIEPYGHRARRRRRQRGLRRVRRDHAEFDLPGHQLQRLCWNYRRGVGPWVIRQIKGSFPEPSPDSSPPKSNAGKKGKKTRGPNQYVPELNSAPYAILITLYREMLDGKSYMMKQELIDAAEASGLSRNGIGPAKSKAKPGSFASSHKDRFTGWTCMSKKSIPKLLVVKSGNPAKYMLTEEGQATARDCLSRSGLDDPAGPSVTTNALNISTAHRNSDNLFMGSAVAETSLRPHMTISRLNTSVAGHSPELICSNSSTITSQELINLTIQEQLSYNSEIPTTSNCSGKIVLSVSDSDEPYRGNSPLTGFERFTERSPKLKAHSSSSLDISKRPTTNFGASDLFSFIPRNI